MHHVQGVIGVQSFMRCRRCVPTHCLSYYRFFAAPTPCADVLLDLLLILCQGRLLLILTFVHLCILVCEFMIVNNGETVDAVQMQEEKKRLCADTLCLNLLWWFQNGFDEIGHLDRIDET